MFALVFFVLILAGRGSWALEHHPSAVACNVSDATYVFYNRIGKAGSTLMREWLMKHQKQSRMAFVASPGSHEAYTMRRTRSHRDVEEAFAKWAEGALTLAAARDGGGGRVLEAHVYYVDWARLGLPVPIYINVMRDPAERYVSQFEFWRGLGNDFGQRVRKSGMTLSKCAALVDPPPECPIRNYQTAYLCGHGPECTYPVDEKTYQTARRRLQEEYMLVGLFSDLPGTVAMLEKLLPKVFSTSLSVKKARNVGKRRQAGIMLVRKSEANKYDEMLYKEAQALFNAKKAACGIKARGLGMHSPKDKPLPIFSGAGARAETVGAARRSSGRPGGGWGGANAVRSSSGRKEDHRFPQSRAWGSAVAKEPVGTAQGAQPPPWWAQLKPKDGMPAAGSVLKYSRPFTQLQTRVGVGSGPRGAGAAARANALDLPEKTLRAMGRGSDRRRKGDGWKW